MIGSRARAQSFASIAASRPETSAAGRPKFVAVTPPLGISAVVMNPEHTAWSWRCAFQRERKAGRFGCRLACFLAAFGLLTGPQAEAAIINITAANPGV